MRAFLCLASFAVLLLAGCKRPAPEAAIRGARGNAVVSDLAGKKGTLADHGRNVTVVSLWSVSCKPCMKELPYLDQLSASYAGDPDVSILAVNVGDEPTEAREATKGLEHLKILVDSEMQVARLLSPGGLTLPLLATIDASFRIHRETGLKDVPAAAFVAEKRQRIEAARRGELTEGEPSPPGSASFGAKVPMTPEAFRTLRPRIRETFKSKYHLSDADADKMVDQLEAQLESDAGTPKVVVPGHDGSGERAPGADVATP